MPSHSNHRQPMLRQDDHASQLGCSLGLVATIAQTGFVHVMNRGGRMAKCCLPEMSRRARAVIE